MPRAHYSIEGPERRLGGRVAGRVPGVRRVFARRVVQAVSIELPRRRRSVCAKVMSNVCFGSLADLQPNISLMSAFGQKRPERVADSNQFLVLSYCSRALVRLALLDVYSNALKYLKLRAGWYKNPHPLPLPLLYYLHLCFVSTAWINCRFKDNCISP